MFPTLVYYTFGHISKPTYNNFKQRPIASTNSLIIILYTWKHSLLIIDIESDVLVNVCVCVEMMRLSSVTHCVVKVNCGDMVYVTRRAHYTPTNCDGKLIKPQPESFSESKHVFLHEQ